MSRGVGVIHHAWFVYTCIGNSLSVMEIFIELHFWN